MLREVDFYVASRAIMSPMKRNLLRYLIAVVLVGLILGAYFCYRKSSGEDSQIEVKRGSLSEEVIVTGKTKSAEETSLGFEVGGKIKSVPSIIGKKVYVGELLLSLEDGDLLAVVYDVKASLDGEKARLEELKKGKRPEEIKIQEGKIQSASVSLSESARNVGDKIEDAYTKSDDAIRAKADQFMSNSRTISPTLNISVSDFQLKTDIETMRARVERELTAWLADNALLNAEEKSATELSASMDKTKERLYLMKSFLTKVGLAVNYLTPSSSLTQTIIDGYKSDVSTARANINTAITNLSTAEEKWKSASAALILEENQFFLDKAGSSEEKISVQEAVVLSAEAKLLSAETKLKKAYLRSPLNGIVTKQDGKSGEIVSAGASLVSVMSLSNFEIEANVPEVDIGKISIGNLVNLTFDAFPGLNFFGRVVFINPAETVIDGVVNFKIKVFVEGDTTKLKSGLTSNLVIETRKVDNVLILPQYAILEKDVGSYVRKIVNGREEEIKISLGLRGGDGLVEVTSGLSEGDKVLNIGLKTK